MFSGDAEWPHAQGRLMAQNRGQFIRQRQSQELRAFIRAQVLEREDGNSDRFVRRDAITLRSCRMTSGGT